MSTLLSSQLLREGLGELFHCSQQGDYTRVRTPFLYPDGDNIDVFVKEQGDSLAITDLGETTRWLSNQTVSARRSPKQEALIEDICLTHGVEFFRGMLVARCREPNQAAAVLTRVAQASLRVADLWFTYRTRAVESVTDEIADLLAERRLPFERAEKLMGRSGKSWVVDFHVRAPAATSLVCVLATGSKSAARGVVEHVVATWYDLNQLTVGPEAVHFVSLFDDTVDVWSEHDFRLVEPLSQVLRWSVPEQVMDELQRAA